MRFLDHMKAELPRKFAGIALCDFGHIVDGGVHFNLVISRDDRRFADGAFVDALQEWVIGAAVQDFAGSFSAEHAIGRKNQMVYDRYTAQKLKDMASVLKMQTSPSGLGSVRFG